MVLRSGPVWGKKNSVLVVVRRQKRRNSTEVGRYETSGSTQKGRQYKQIRTTKLRDIKMILLSCMFYEGS